MNKRPSKVMPLIAEKWSRVNLTRRTDGSFTYTQHRRDVLLLPALFFQLPGAFAPFFSPIGFSWCSHPPILAYFTYLCRDQ